MSKQPGPAAAVLRIWLSRADRNYAAAHGWVKQTGATGKMLSLPDEDRPAAGEEVAGAPLPMAPASA